MLFYIIYEKHPKKIRLSKKSSLHNNDIKSIIAFTTNNKYAKLYIDNKNLYIKEAHLDDIEYKKFASKYDDRRIRFYRVHGSDEYLIMTKHDKINIEQEVEFNDYIKQRATIYN